jgi:hypothetical protein
MFHSGRSLSNIFCSQQRVVVDFSPKDNDRKDALMANQNKE